MYDFTDARVMGFYADGTRITCMLLASKTVTTKVI